MTDGHDGFGRGQLSFDKPLTTLDQIAEAEESAKASMVGVESVTVLFFSLWHTEEEDAPITENRWQWKN